MNKILIEYVYIKWIKAVVFNVGDYKLLGDKGDLEDFYKVNAKLILQK